MKSSKIAQKTNISFLDRMGVSSMLLRRGILVIMMAIFLEFVLK